MNPVFRDDASLILELCGKIYERDAKLKKETLEKILEVHAVESLPEMLKIKTKIKADFENLKVEPSSALGGHYKYFIKHFENFVHSAITLAPQFATMLANASSKEQFAIEKILCFSKISSAQLWGTSSWPFSSQLQKTTSSQ